MASRVYVATSASLDCPSSRVRAVSYTHLDVYKRQVLGNVVEEKMRDFTFKYSHNTYVAVYVDSEMIEMIGERHITRGKRIYC